MIYEQLRNHCNCIKEEITDADIDELINLISMYTCWTQKPCDTFLSGDRRQVIDLPDCVDDCTIFEFDPFFYPFDKDSFKFTLVSQTGIEEETTELTDFAYSETDQLFRLNLPLPGCACQPDCGCPTNYKLIAEYVAGYEEIPECLLPLFCEALQYVKERKKCDCSKCQTCENQYQADQVEVLVFDAAKLTDQLKVYFVQTLTEQYKRQLSLISLCKRQNDLWGFTV